MTDLKTIDQLEGSLSSSHIQQIRCRVIEAGGSLQEYQDTLAHERQLSDEALRLSREMPLESIEIELSEQDIGYCLDILRGLTPSLVQSLVPKGEAHKANLKQRSIKRLITQLELKLGAIELAREALET